jgi:hypothetical protein
MKKIKFIALGVLAFITIASTVFISCRKQQKISTIEPTTKAIHSRQQVQTEGWVNAHSSKRKCLRGNGNCDYAVVSEDLNSESCNPVTIRLIRDNKLSIIYNIPVELEDGNFLHVESPVNLPDVISHKLGKKTISINQGVYEILYNNYSNGERIVDITSTN